jgi:hypothetical protein
MVDIHLINMTLAGFGIAVGVAILIAVSILAIGSVRQRRISARQDQLVAARAAVRARAARTTVAAAQHESAQHESAERELAIR